jgi:predicted SAM-dependent methyltransferase
MQTNNLFECPVCNQLTTYERLDERYMGGFDVDGIHHGTDQCETLNIEHYSCSNCGATDRERLYMLYFMSMKEKLNDLTFKQKMIHFAPEPSLSNYMRKSRLFDYYTADLLMSHVDHQVDITDMHIYEDESTDMFICSHILEHIIDEEDALSELYRILKPGGHGILMVPVVLSLDETYEDPTKTTEAERLKHFGQEDHVRLYSKKGYMNKLCGAGFKVKELGINEFGQVLFNKTGITERSVLYVVQKNI